MQTGNTNYIYKSDLDKICYIKIGKYKDLTKRTLSARVLRDKALKLQIIQNMIDMKEV